MVSSTSADFYNGYNGYNGAVRCSTDRIFVSRLVTNLSLKLLVILTETWTILKDPNSRQENLKNRSQIFHGQLGSLCLVKRNGQFWFCALLLCKIVLRFIRLKISLNMREDRGGWILFFFSQRLRDAEIMPRIWGGGGWLSGWGAGSLAGSQAKRLVVLRRRDLCGATHDFTPLLSNSELLISPGGEFGLQVVRGGEWGSEVSRILETPVMRGRGGLCFVRYQKWHATFVFQTFLP